MNRKKDGAKHQESGFRDESSVQKQQHSGFEVLFDLRCWAIMVCQRGNN